MPSLLPQPGGFEGLGSLPIGPDPGDSAAAHGPNQCDALVHGKTAAPTPATPQSRDVVPFDLGVVKLGERFPVLPPLSVEHGADDLDVLLRHRPSSIPRS